MYIVNPERFKLCGMSKAAGLLVLGLVLVGIQVILLASWMGARPPRVLCTTSGHLECAALIRVEDHYPMVYGYPVLLGLIICGLSGISLKWKTNSGATWNLLALTVTFIAWAVTATVETLSSKGNLNHYFNLYICLSIHKTVRHSSAFHHHSSFKRKNY